MELIGKLRKKIVGEKVRGGDGGVREGIVGERRGGTKEHRRKGGGGGGGISQGKMILGDFFSGEKRSLGKRSFGKDPQGKRFLGQKSFGYKILRENISLGEKIGDAQQAQGTI